MASVEDGPFRAEEGDHDVLEGELLVAELLPHLVEDPIVEPAQRLADLGPVGHLRRVELATLQLDQAVLEGQLRFILATTGHQEEHGADHGGQAPSEAGRDPVDAPADHQTPVAWGWFSRTPCAVTRTNSALAQNSSMVRASL